jgi:thiosulfate dehydrogenase
VDNGVNADAAKQIDEKLPKLPRLAGSVRTAINLGNDRILGNFFFASRLTILGRETHVKKFLLGLILGLLIPAAIGYGYFRYGYAPMATSAPPMPLEKTMARMALHAHIEKEGPKKEAPMAADEANLSAGAAIYSQNCAFCHGLPNQKPTMAARGMFPLPPQLLEKDEMVTDDPAGVTFWKVSNGIRMTGMPGFGEMLTPTQVWQVSLLLSKADKLPPQVQAALTPQAATPVSGQSPPAVPQAAKKKN